MILPPREPMRTGGAGSVTEVLVVLSTLGAAALSALAIAWRKAPPPPETTDEPSSESDDEGG